MTSGNNTLNWRNARYAGRGQPNIKAVVGGANSIPLWSELIKFEALKDTARSMLQRGRRAAGIDGVGMHDLSQLERNAALRQIAQKVQRGDYRAAHFRLVRLAKDDGSHRNIKIPAVLDQLLAILLNFAVGPYVSSRLPRSMQGFLPGRSTHKLLLNLEQRVNQGFFVLVQADVYKAFDHVPGARALRNLADMLHTDDVEEQASREQIVNHIGRVLGISTWRNLPGIPQGNALSPLLFNVYLYRQFIHRLDTQDFGELLVYADNLVAIVKEPGVARPFMQQVSHLLEPAGMRLKEDPTVTDLSQEQEATTLGFRVRLGQTGLEYDIPETKWEELSKELDKCWEGGDSNRTARRLITGWLYHYRPCLRERMEETVTRTVELLSSKGFIDDLKADLTRTAGAACLLWEKERSKWQSATQGARVLRTQPFFYVENDRALPAVSPAGRVFLVPPDDEMPF